MSGGGSSTPAFSPYEVDPAQMSAWLKTAAGSQYASTYNPNSTYAQGANGQILALPSGSSGNGKPFNITQGQDVSGMISAFNTWVAGNTQTQANWQNYADKANANQGGEGDNTVTFGAAMSQRNAILGGLSNAGNPTTPTPGLGSMGTLLGNGSVVNK